MSKPKVLIIDVETAPVIAQVWDIWDQNVGLNQIVKDWHLLSFAAKWLERPEIIYMDQRSVKPIEHDEKLAKAVWGLLDEADVILTQNGKKFDAKKLNARFILNKLPPPSPYKHIDTCESARKTFGFTSNKLEYLTDKLCKKYKKLVHREFPGHELWKEVLNGNIKAWKEMEKYNKVDVLALEELYHVMLPWIDAINFNLYSESLQVVCNCGSQEFQKRGYAYTALGKFQTHRCKECGAWSRDATNLLSKEKRSSLRRKP